MPGTHDIEACERAAHFGQWCDAHFGQWCDAFDALGVLPGVGQEHNGIIRHGAELLSAHCDAVGPRMQVHPAQGTRRRAHRS